MKLLFIPILTVLFNFAQANNWPAQPTGNEPGSSVYSNELFHETLTVKGRTVDFFAPKNFQTSGQKLTVVIYGHGQAVQLKSYQDTFEHLAKKGIAVVFPQYDTGFFDQDWRRMAADFVDLTTETLKKYPNSFETSRVIFAGHSKGGYVALVAAGIEPLGIPYTAYHFMAFCQ